MWEYILVAVAISGLVATLTTWILCKLEYRAYRQKLDKTPEKIDAFVISVLLTCEV